MSGAPLRNVFDMLDPHVPASYPGQFVHSEVAGASSVFYYDLVPVVMTCSAETFAEVFNNHCTSDLHEKMGMDPHGCHSRVNGHGTPTCGGTCCPAANESGHPRPLAMWSGLLSCAHEPTHKIGRNSPMGAFFKSTKITL